MTADILRLVAGGLLALICCYGGVLIRRHYIEREKFFADAEAFAAYLTSELGFPQDSAQCGDSGFRGGQEGCVCGSVAAFFRRARVGRDAGGRHCLRRRKRETETRREEEAAGIPFRSRHHAAFRSAGCRRALEGGLRRKTRLKVAPKRADASEACTSSSPCCSA